MFSRVTNVRYIKLVSVSTKHRLSLYVTSIIIPTTLFRSISTATTNKTNNTSLRAKPRPEEFWANLNKAWSSPNSQGLLYRSPDIIISKKATDLQKEFGKYAEASIFTRTSPPVMYKPQTTDPKIPSNYPQIGILYNENILSHGYRVAAFEGHPFSRYPITRFYDPGRPSTDLSRNGKGEDLYVQTSELPTKPIDLTGLQYIGTSSNAKILSKTSPQLNIFGLEVDKLPNYDEINVATDPIDQGGLCNPRKIHNAAGVPYLGTLNAWQPYFDCIDTMIGVRNVNMLISNDKIRLDVLKLWSGGFEPSLWANLPLDDVDNILGIFVGHPGPKYDEYKLKEYKLDNKELNCTLHKALDDYMTYYFGDKGKIIIDELGVVELFNTVWNSQGKWDYEDKKPNLWEKAVEDVSAFCETWMNTEKDKREDLSQYAAILSSH